MLAHNPAEVLARLEALAAEAVPNQKLMLHSQETDARLLFTLVWHQARRTTVQMDGLLIAVEGGSRLESVFSVPAEEQRGAWISVGLLIVTSLLAGLLLILEGVWILLAAPAVMLVYLAILAWQIQRDQRTLESRVGEALGDL